MKKQKPLKVIAGTSDKPLIISGIKIQCYVLEDETRVFSQGGFLEAIGRSRSPTAGKGAFSDVDNLPTFLRSTNLKPFISKDLILSTTPIKFRVQTGALAIGYNARLLHDVCEVYLKARDANALLPSQMHIAERAEILMRGFSLVGIVALVDEATGYQKLREERALATILEKFIAKELQPWTKTFPYDFYKYIFLLKNWQGPDGVKKPSVIGHYTNDFVYDRLAPGILAELKQINPKTPSGYRKVKHHQWFTPDIGHPKLKEHLAAVIALLKAAPNWVAFLGSLNRALPKINDTMELPFDYDSN